MKESADKFDEYIRQTTPSRQKPALSRRIGDGAARILPVAVVVGAIAWFYLQGVLPKVVFASEAERLAFIASVRENPDKRVIALVTSWCPACANMEASLRKSSIPYIRLDIEQSAPGRALYEQSVKLTGARGIPQVIVDRTWVGHSFSGVRSALEASKK
jgi:glutaredoxin